MLRGREFQRPGPNTLTVFFYVYEVSNGSYVDHLSALFHMSELIRYGETFQ